MEKISTKEKILFAALDLFSKYGYKATSTEQIATAVGIKKPSLYDHYKNKHDILDSLIEKLTNEYNKGSIFSNDIDSSKLSTKYIIKLVQEQAKFLIHNENIIKIRRFLTIEQYRNPQICELQNKHIYTNVLNYNKSLIKVLIENNILVDKDIEIMASQFAFPVTVWINLCDRYPESEKEVMKKIGKHVSQFMEIYKKKGI